MPEQPAALLLPGIIIGIFIIFPWTKCLRGGGIPGAAGLPEAAGVGRGAAAGLALRLIWNAHSIPARCIPRQETQERQEK